MSTSYVVVKAVVLLTSLFSVFASCIFVVNMMSTGMQ